MAKKKRESKFKDKVRRNVDTKKQASSSYGYLNLPNGVNVFKPEPGGRCELDFMPYLVSDKRHMDRDEEYKIAIPGEHWYKKPYLVHKNVGSDEESVVCPKTFGKPCPICEHRLQLAKEGETDREILKGLSPKDRILYIVVPLKAKDPDGKSYEEKPHIMDISYWMFQKLLDDELQENEDNMVFPGLEDGKTLRIRWDSKKIDKGSAFAEVSRIDFIERDEVYDESMEDDIPDLDKVLAVLSYKELETLFFDYEEDDDDATDDEDFDEVDDEEEKPKRKKKKATRKPKPEEDEDDDAEDTDDDEEEEEKPKRKKKPARKPEPEEDDEDEDEEEDEEPVKKKTSKKSSGKKKCPYGHKYGKDADEKEDCNSCDLWDSCLDEKEKNED